MTQIAWSVEIKEEDIEVTKNLMDDLTLGSLDIVEMVLRLEDEFGIEIYDEDAQKWKTVQDVINYIKERKK